MISNWTLVVLSKNEKNVYDLHNFLAELDDGKCDFFCVLMTSIVVVQRIGINKKTAASAYLQYPIVVKMHLSFSLDS